METNRTKRTMMVLGVIFFTFVFFSSGALLRGSATYANDAIVKIMTQNTGMTDKVLGALFMS